MNLNIPEYGEYIRANYMGDRYASQSYAVMKFICMIVCILCSLLFVFSGRQDQCPIWVYSLLHGAMLASAIFIALSYIGTILKVGLCCPLTWVYTDTILCILTSLLIVIASVTSMAMRANTNSAPAVLAILTALLLVIACAVMHAKTRHLWRQTVQKDKAEEFDLENS